MPLWEPSLKLCFIKEWQDSIPWTDQSPRQRILVYFNSQNSGTWAHKICIFGVMFSPILLQASSKVWIFLLSVAVEMRSTFTFSLGNIPPTVINADVRISSRARRQARWFPSLRWSKSNLWRFFKIFTHCENPLTQILGYNHFTVFPLNDPPPGPAPVMNFILFLMILQAVIFW